MKIIDCGISAYVKDRIRSNDKKWFITNMLIVTIFLGYILLDRNAKDERFETFKNESIVKVNKFQDSLIEYCDMEYNVTNRCIGRAKK